MLDGHVADYLIVSARIDSGEGIGLFLVDSQASGITKKQVKMVDSRNAANLGFEEVNVPRSALMEGELKGSVLLDYVLDAGRAGLAAEMLGIIHEAFNRTLIYLRERQQFGVAIGSFQALQHRAAHIFSEIELCKSVVFASFGCSGYEI